MLFKKREHRVLLRIQDQRGAWLFTVEGIKLDDLRAGLHQIWERYAN